MLDIKKEKIAVLCDTKEKVEKFYKSFNLQVNKECFTCWHPNNLYISFYEDELTWDSDGWHKREGYELITFNKFEFEEIKEEQIDRDEMIEKLDDFCLNQSCCKCVFGDESCDFKDLSDEDLTNAYNLAFVVKEVEEEDDDENMKFKVGDVVKGNKLSDKYGFTDTRVLKAKVISINKDGEIEIEILEYDGSDREIGAKYDELDVECFDLVSDLSSKILTITASDTITTLTDGTHTTTINCYYTDKHDERVAVEYVVKKYYDELNEIDRVNKMPKVGDKVKVINNGRTYSNYDTWLIKNNINIKYAVKWISGKSPTNEYVYKIVAIYKHLDSKDILALIEDEYNCYIINVEGLEVVK